MFSNYWLKTIREPASSFNLIALFHSPWYCCCYCYRYLLLLLLQLPLLLWRIPFVYCKNILIKWWDTNSNRTNLYASSIIFFFELYRITCDFPKTTNDTLVDIFLVFFFFLLIFHRNWLKFTSQFHFTFTFFDTQFFSNQSLRRQSKAFLSFFLFGSVALVCVCVFWKSR